MSRRTVRVGIAEFFGGTTWDSDAKIYRPTPLAAEGLAGVKPYWSTRFEDHDYFIGLADDRFAGAVMCVHIADDAERRIALGGPTGGFKRRPFQVELWVFHMARTAWPEDAQEHLDDLIEAVIDRIHGDRTLGGAVVEAGESERGISTATGAVPQVEPGTPPTVRQEAVIRFDAVVYPQA